MSEISDILSTVEEQDLKQKIVEELLDSEKNLETKTELLKPIGWATLNVMHQFIEDRQLPKSARILKQFEQISFTFMISKKRQGRKEYIEALQSLNHMDVETDKPILNRPIA